MANSIGGIWKIEISLPTAQTFAGTDLLPRKLIAHFTKIVCTRDQLLLQPK